MGYDDRTWRWFRERPGTAVASGTGWTCGGARGSSNRTNGGIQRVSARHDASLTIGAVQHARWALRDCDEFSSIHC